MKIDKDIEKARKWWRNYVKSRDEKLKPKTWLGRLFYTPTSELDMKLQEETFILGFSHGVNNAMTKQLNRQRRETKKLHNVVKEGRK